MVWAPGSCWRFSSRSFGYMVRWSTASQVGPQLSRLTNTCKPILKLSRLDHGCLGWPRTFRAGPQLSILAHRCPNCAGPQLLQTSPLLSWLAHSCPGWPTTVQVGHSCQYWSTVISASSQQSRLAHSFPVWQTVVQAGQQLSRQS
jgi:hypothetical protein